MKVHQSQVAHISTLQLACFFYASFFLSVPSFFPSC